MRTSVPAGILGILLILGACEGVSAQPVAGVLVTVDGPVSIHRVGGRMPAARGTSLAPGDSLVLKAGGHCSGFSPTGEAFHREGPALIVFASSAADNFKNRVTRWVARQLAQWVGSSRSRPLIARSGANLNEPADPILPVAPGINGAVRGPDVSLTWRPVPGIDEFAVTVVDPGGGERTETVNGNEYRLSALEPGATYAWRISFNTGATVLRSPWREFRVMTVDEAKALDEALADLDDMMAGIVLLAAGLHLDAAERLDGVAAAGSPDAAYWRARALAGLGLYEAAYESLLGAVERE